MKRKVFLIPMIALAGISLPFALSNEPSVVKAEDESVSIAESVDELSSIDSSYQNVNISNEETEQDLKDKIAELEKKLEEKFKEFQSTKLYAIVIEIGAVVYMLWGVLDKILQRKTLKTTKELSDNNLKAIEKTVSESEAIDTICKELRADYGKATSELETTKVELDKTAKTLETVIEQNKELATQLATLGKAFLELCKHDPALVEGEAYKVVEKVLNGADTNE